MLALHLPDQLDLFHPRLQLSRIVCLCLLLACAIALIALVGSIQTAQAAGEPVSIQKNPANTRLDFSLSASPAQTETITTTIFLPVVQNHKPLPVKEPGYKPGAGTLYCSNLGSGLSIPDNTTAGITNTLIIPDARYVGDLNVYLNISHSWVGDLVVNLTHHSPVSGDTTITLLNRPGLTSQENGCGKRDLVAILDDDSPLAAQDWCGGNRISSSIPGIAGIFSAYTPLTTFIGEDISGEWSLNIADQNVYNTGNLKSWCLDVDLTDTPYSPPTPPLPPDLPASHQIEGVYGGPQTYHLDCESRSAVDWARFFGFQIGDFTYGDRNFFSGLLQTDNPDTGFVGYVDGQWGYIPPNDYGVHAKPIAERLIQYGVEAHYYRRLRWDDVRVEISQDRPVIVWVAGRAQTSYPEYYTPKSDGKTTLVAPYEHTVILTGYTPDSVTILDQGIPYTISLPQFLNSWSTMRFMAVMAR